MFLFNLFLSKMKFWREFLILTLRQKYNRSEVFEAIDGREFLATCVVGLQLGFLSTYLHMVKQLRLCPAVPLIWRVHTCSIFNHYDISLRTGIAKCTSTRESIFSSIMQYMEYYKNTQPVSCM